MIDNFFTNELLQYVNELASKTIKKYEVVSIRDKLLSEYFQSSFKSKNRKHIVEFNLMEPKSDYPIHDEAHWKKLSITT